MTRDDEFWAHVLKDALLATSGTRLIFLEIIVVEMQLRFFLFVVHRQGRCRRAVVLLLSAFLEEM